MLLADDQQIVRAGLRLILDDEPAVRIVGEVADGQAAVDRARLLEPDIVLMDIEMPIIDGIEATRRLIALPRGPKVLVLTTFERDDYVASALQAGASGFLLKSAPAEDLVAALRTVAAGDSILSPTVTRRLIERFCEQTLAARRDDLLEPLSAREREVLLLMARGLSNDESAGALLVSIKTVKSHVSNTLTKLGLRDRIQAVVFATRPGSSSREMRTRTAWISTIRRGLRMDDGRTNHAARRSQSRVRMWLADAMVVVGLFAVQLSTVARDHNPGLLSGLPAAGAIVGVGMLAPLLVRRRWPVAVLMVVAAATIASQLVHPPHLVVPGAAVAIAAHGAAVEAPH